MTRALHFFTVGNIVLNIFETLDKTISKIRNDIQEPKNEWKLIILNTNNTKLKIIKPIKIITECWEVHQNQVSAKNLSTKSTFMIIISSSSKKSNLLCRKPVILYVISSFMSVMWISFCLSFRNAKCNIWTQLTFRLWRE